MGRVIKKGFFWGRNSFLRIWSIIIGFILTLFYGCDGPGRGVAAYGCPHATYKIKGKVTSKVGGQGLKEISVRGSNDTTVTNDSGEYYLEISETAGELCLNYTDMNPSNGLYASKDTLVTFDNSEFIGGDGWFTGTATRDVDIALDLFDDDDENQD